MYGGKKCNNFLWSVVTHSFFYTFISFSCQQDQTKFMLFSQLDTFFFTLTFHLLFHARMKTSTFFWCFLPTHTLIPSKVSVMMFGIKHKISFQTSTRYRRRILLSTYTKTFPVVTVQICPVGMYLCMYGCVLIPARSIPPYHCRCSQCQLSFHSVAAVWGAVHAGACLLSLPFWHTQRCCSSRLCVED